MRRHVSVTHSETRSSLLWARATLATTIIAMRARFRRQAVAVLAAQLVLSQAHAMGHARIATREPRAAELCHAVAVGATGRIPLTRAGQSARNAGPGGAFGLRRRVQAPGS